MGRALNGAAPLFCTKCFDAWSWLVLYVDGTELFECAGTQAPHAAWANVNVPLVRSLVLLPRIAGLEQVVLDRPSADMEPVFFRRRYKELNLAAGTETNQQTIHCVGFERDGEGSYVFVFEDGSVLLSPLRNAV